MLHGGVIEMVIWQLAETTPERPHGLKYRLVYVKGDVRVVGYDNETGKGDHKHLAEQELLYRFVNVETLVADVDRERHVAAPYHSLLTGESWRGGTVKVTETFIIRSGAGAMSVMRM